MARGHLAGTSASDVGGGGWLSAVAVFAALGGGLLYRFSRQGFRVVIHVTLVLAASSSRFASTSPGAVAGIYSVMFVWVVIVAACVATRRQLALHITWILLNYGLVIVAVEGESLGWSPVTRFV